MERSEKSEKSLVGAFSCVILQTSRMFVCSSTVSLCGETGAAACQGPDGQMSRAGAVKVRPEPSITN